MGQKMLDALQEFIKKVRAKLKEIGTPEAKQLFDNHGRASVMKQYGLLQRLNVVMAQARKPKTLVGVPGIKPCQ